jgi:branched-chain amino acid transport system substrate-binding protein
MKRAIPRTLILVLLALALVAVVGCTQAPPDTEALSDAEARIAELEAQLSDAQDTGEATDQLAELEAQLADAQAELEAAQEAAAAQEEAPADTAAAEETSWEDWETIPIGSPTIFTGVGAPMGMDITAGLSMAVDKINAEGGVLGKPLEIVFSDAKSTGAEDCALAFQVLDRAGVVAYFPGAYFGTACIHEAGQREAPLFHGSASKDMVQAVLDNMPEYGNVFQTTANEASYGPTAFNVMTEVIDYEYPNNKIALLGGDITYDMIIQQSAREAFEGAGWEVVLDDTYPYGTTEFGAQLATIRAEEPAIVFGVITSTDSSVAFMNQFLENPTNSLIYIQWSPASPEFIGLLGDKANGVLWQTLSAYLPTPENEEWVAQFEATYGRMPGATWPATVEDQLYIWKNAVEACGSPVDYACIDDWIANLADHPYEGRMGVYGMDPEFENRAGLSGDEWVPNHFIQIQNQENHTLFLGTQPVEGEAFEVPPWIQ